MAKPGRNDPCPCGSGNKYKKCCLSKDEAAQAPHDRGDADPSAAAERFKNALAAIAAGAGVDGSEDDALMDASNVVVDLVRAGKLADAEAAARALLARYPEVPDGWDRLGMVHEARGENALAADCYRKVVEFLDQNPDYSEPAFRDAFAERIVKLDPPPAT
jgi:tetratricopeptide (TPR) repeat protein